ncbi:MAG: cadherin repeat domain-containing protein, partial [Burkholderiales bacterium]|nr:cadherin repeat domain-containing protein [Burkholderiales bacterium]
TDNGTPVLNASKAITVSVTNVNDTPVITSGTTASAAENIAANTVVYTATATDQDVGQTLTYSLSGTDAASFTINATTGAVSIISSPNFEAKASYSFNVVATDNGTPVLNASKAVTLNITNVNEAPVVTSLATASVVEGTPTSTVVYTATATDVDAGTTLTYSLSGTDAAAFDINASTGAVTLKAVPNFDTKNSYSFNVVATDNGTPALNASKAVTLNVTDTALTIFSDAVVSVPENLPSNTVVYNARAYDPLSNSSITFSVSGTDAAAFNIDANSGAVTLKNRPDYETKPSYSFNVIATENNTAATSSSKAVTLNITDNANELLTITSPAIATIPERTNMVTVNDPTLGTFSGIYVYTITAATQWPTAHYEFSLLSYNSDKFIVQQETGNVYLKNASDLYPGAVYKFNAYVYDDLNLTAFVNKVVEIDVLNVNDPPVVTSASTVSIADHLAAGSKVYTTTYSDIDGDLVDFSLSGPDASAFDIHPLSGVVKLKATADAATKASYNFNVIVTDEGSPLLTTIKAVTINVAPTPVISSAASFNVLENMPVGTTVYTATTSAPPVLVSGVNYLSYSLSGADASAFSINSTTGAVSLKVSPDYETKTSYNFNVVAYDGGTGLQGSKAVTLNVINAVSETIAFADTRSAITVAENVATTAAIYNIQATTNLANPNMSYSISGVDASQFAVNATTGAVTFVNSPNYEAKSIYHISVTATDVNHSANTISEAVDINIQNLRRYLVFERQCQHWRGELDCCRRLRHQIVLFS